MVAIAPVPESFSTVRVPVSELFAICKAVAGVVVPTPIFPQPCCTTNCVPPIVKPWPEAMVVVPVVFVSESGWEKMFDPEKVLLSESSVEEAADAKLGHVVLHVSPVRQNVVADNTDVLAVVLVLGYGVMLLVALLYVQPTVTARAVAGRNIRAASMTRNFFILNIVYPLLGCEARCEYD